MHILIMIGVDDWRITNLSVVVLNDTHNELKEVTLYCYSKGHSHIGRNFIMMLHCVKKPFSQNSNDGSVPFNNYHW